MQNLGEFGPGFVCVCVCCCCLVKSFYLIVYPKLLPTSVSRKHWAHFRKDWQSQWHLYIKESVLVFMSLQNFHGNKKYDTLINKYQKKICNKNNCFEEFNNHTNFVIINQCTYIYCPFMFQGFSASGCCFHLSYCKSCLQHFWIIPREFEV